MVNGRFSSRSVVLKIDTGADINAISKSTFDTLPTQSTLHPLKTTFSFQEAGYSLLNNLRQ